MLNLIEKPKSHKLINVFLVNFVIIIIIINVREQICVLSYFINTHERPVIASLFFDRLYLIRSLLKRNPFVYHQ